jgi:hypothetical protein
VSSIWSAAWNEAAKLCNWAAAAGYSASRVRDVPSERVDLMERMFDNLRKADGPAFNEVICKYAQHAANGIAEVVGLRAEVEEARASRPVDDDDPTPVVPAVPPPPEAKGGS